MALRAKTEVEQRVVNHDAKGLKKAQMKGFAMIKGEEKYLQGRKAQMDQERAKHDQELDQTVFAAEKKATLVARAAKQRLDEAVKEEQSARATWMTAVQKLAQGK